MPVSATSPALVRGAGPGLGLQIARRFGRAGHPVVLAARGADRLDDHVATLRNEGVTALAVPADLRDPDHRRNVVAAAQREFGAVGVVCHGPGAANTTARATPLPQTDPDDVRALVDRMVLPAIDVAALVLPGMIERGAGALLLVTVCRRCARSPSSVARGAIGSAVRLRAQPPRGAARHRRPRRGAGHRRARGGRRHPSTRRGDSGRGSRGPARPRSTRDLRRRVGPRDPG
jgi:NADP-dependent 3-hydroxy acid dehydrogenase YdfG